MHKIKILLVLLLILTAGIIRFYKLSDYPIQLNHDEISQLYDTASIVKTKKDIYGNYLPLAFPSTGDYKVGHYIYFSILPYLIFGDKEFTIRIAAAFFGTLTIGGVFLFIFIFTKNFWLAFSSAFLITITPSEVFYSRKSFENIIGVTFVLLGLFCLFKYLDKLNLKFLKYIGMFLLCSAMYIYTSYTIVVPLIILLFALLFRRKIFLSNKDIIYSLLFLFILIIPLILITGTNSGLRHRAASVFITQDANLGKQLDFSNLSLKTYIDYIINKYLTQFDLSYIFGNGLNLTDQGLIGMGPLLFLQLPLFLLGIFFTIKTTYISKNKKIFILSLGLIPMIPSALTFEGLSPHRAVLEFSILSIISGFGLYWIFVKSNILVKTFVVLLLCLNFTYFIHMYTVNYPFEKSQQIHYPFKQVTLFAVQQKNNFNQIIIDPTYGQSAPVFGVATHYYLAYYGNYDPAFTQTELNIKDDGMSFDKFYIRKIDWRKDQNLKSTLLIGSPWSLPIENIKNKIIKRFNFYDGQVAFYAIKL